MQTYSEKKDYNMKSNKTTSFKKKVQAMKASEIVQAMIDGLNKKWVEVSMGSFGHTVGTICYGCAATNAICEIMNHKITAAEMDEFKLLKTNENLYRYSFLFYFEISIDSLRRGDVDNYNFFANKIDMKNIPKSIERKIKPYLLPLYALNYKGGLHQYQELADLLKKENL